VAPPTWAAAVMVATLRALRELAVDVEAGGGAAVDDVVAVGAAAVADAAEARHHRRDTWFVQEYRWADWRYMIY
jgi:hypothetical protein